MVGTSKPDIGRGRFVFSDWCSLQSIPQIFPIVIFKSALLNYYQNTNKW